MRSQENFRENVPFGLLLIALGEGNGIPTRYVHGLLGSLFLFRVLHVEMGLYGKGMLEYGRRIGYFVCLMEC